MDYFIRYFDEDIAQERGILIARPAMPCKKTILAFVHGGGWWAGNRENYIHHLQYFSKKGYLCASLGYRLAPKASFKEQAEDIFTGYDALRSYAHENGMAEKNGIVMGSSAGAHLASILSLAEPRKLVPGIELKNPWKKPDGCIFVNGPATLEKWEPMNEDIKRSIESVLGASYDNDEPEVFSVASPINYVDESSPDFLFMLAGHEKFFPHVFTYEMARKLQKLGKYAQVAMFEEAAHGFFYSLKGDVQKKALELMEAFLDRYEVQ